jgi:hypothetical protein
LAKEGPLKPQIKFDDVDIAYKFRAKLLGIHINENMKWDGHIKYLHSKLCKSYYVINSLKDITSSCVIKSIYYVYFHAHVRYGVVFWGGNPESKGICKLQKRMIRLISNAGRYTS